MIIRPVVNQITTTGTAVNPITVADPGMQYSTKLVRVSNFSPYSCTLRNTSTQFNNPTQTLAPYQQNIYQYSGIRTTIQATFDFISGTFKTFRHFLLVEYCDSIEGFPGRYPVALSGQAFASLTGTFVQRLIAGTNITLTPVDGIGIVTINATGGGAGGVTQLIAGTGIALSPAGGTGVVTVTASGAFIPLTTKGALSGVPSVNAKGSILPLPTFNTSLAFGRTALNGQTTGGINIAIGNGALKALTTPSRNIGIGNNAGTVPTAGSNNIYIGFTTGATVTGATNVIIGSTANAGAGVRTGIAIGTAAKPTAANGISIGLHATGAGIAIGPHATATGAGSIAIGFTVTAPTATDFVLGKATNNYKTPGKFVNFQTKVGAPGTNIPFTVTGSRHFWLNNTNRDVIVYVSLLLFTATATATFCTVRLQTATFITSRTILQLMWAAPVSTMAGVHGMRHGVGGIYVPAGATVSFVISNCTIQSATYGLYVNV